MKTQRQRNQNVLHWALLAGAVVSFEAATTSRESSAFGDVICIIREREQKRERRGRGPNPESALATALRAAFTFH